MTYIKVILPLKLTWEPYYRTSLSDVRSGMRVTVMFARRKYVAVVSATDVVPDIDDSKISEILSVEKHLDPIGENEIKFWRFLSEYYLCTIGEVYKLAYPAVKTSGEMVSARVEDRRELMAERRREAVLKRIGTLEERLSKKRGALEGRHGDKVRAALEAQVQQLEDQLKELGETLASLERDSVDVAPKALTGKPVGAGGTLLLDGGESRLEAVFDRIGGTLAQGRSVLMLVPEISLARNLQDRLEERFGGFLMVFHSKENAGRRRSIAAALRAEDGPKLILGTRSALFLPFRELGLVVVEEEYDFRYKEDSAPRYNARDAAVVLAGLFGADVVLSSPTPSLESLYNAVSGRYEHLTVPSDQPTMEVVDTSVEQRKRGMVGSLSRVLISYLGQCIGEGGKALILRPWGPMDDIEAEVRAIFPDAPAGLISYKTVYEARREPVDQYALLAFLATDVLLNKQDFRADERLVQVLEQFRGRFGGVMLVQTKQGEHPVFVHGADWSLNLLAERKTFSFPPYTRMLDVIVRDSNPARLSKLSRELAGSLAGFSPMGPFAPVRGRTQEEGTMALRIMLSRDKHLADNKKEIAGIIGDFENSRKYTGHIVVDVDPV